MPSKRKESKKTPVKSKQKANLGPTKPIATAATSGTAAASGTTAASGLTAAVTSSETPSPRRSDREPKPRLMWQPPPINYGLSPSNPPANPRTHFYTVQNPHPNQPIFNVSHSSWPKRIAAWRTDTVIFDPNDWVGVKEWSRPWNIAKTIDVVATWPPTNAEQLLNMAFPFPGMTEHDERLIKRKGKDTCIESVECLGKWCWQRRKSPYCGEFNCSHNLTEWLTGGADWESRFELRDAGSKGVGVYSKYKWTRDTVLGIYTGALTPSNDVNNGYLAAFPVGPEFTKREAVQFAVDAGKCGNWTRFMNHSCDYNTRFRPARVGFTRVLAVVVSKTINVGDEVTVNYDKEYFKARNMVCKCGAKKCMSKKGGGGVLDKRDDGGSNEESDEDFDALSEDEGRVRCRNAHGRLPSSSEPASHHDSESSSHISISPPTRKPTTKKSTTKKPTKKPTTNKPNPKKPTTKKPATAPATTTTIETPVRPRSGIFGLSPADQAALRERERQERQQRYQAREQRCSSTSGHGRKRSRDGTDESLGKQRSAKKSKKK